MGQNVRTAYAITTGTTPIDCPGPPGAVTTNRVVSEIIVYNADTVAHTYTLYFYDGTANRTIETSASVPSLSTVVFVSDGRALGLYNTTTETPRIAVNAAATTTESTTITKYVDYS